MADVTLAVEAIVSGTADIKALVSEFTKLQGQSFTALTAEISRLSLAIEKLGSVGKGKIKAVGEEAVQAGPGVVKLSGALFVAQIATEAFIAAVNAIPQKFDAFLNLADQTSTLSDRIGLTTSSVQELSFAATIGDTDLGALSQSLRFLTTNALKAGDEGKVASVAFKALGVSTRDAFGNLKDKEKLLQDVATAFETLKDPAEKTALAIAIFGRSGEALIPFLSKGGEGIKALREQFKSLGLVLSEEVVRSADALKDRLTVLKKISEGKINLGFSEALPDIEATVGVIERLIGTANKTNLIGEAIKFAAEVAKEFALGLEITLKFVESLFPASAAVNDNFSLTARIVEEVKRVFVDLQAIAGLIALGVGSIGAAIYSVGAILTGVLIEPISLLLTTLGKVAGAAGLGSIGGALTTASTALNGFQSRMEGFATAQIRAVAATKRSIEDLTKARTDAQQGLLEKGNFTGGSGVGGPKRVTGFTGLVPKAGKAEVDTVKTELALQKAQLEAEFSKIAAGIAAANSIIEDAVTAGTINIAVAFEARRTGLESKFNAERELITSEIANLDRELAALGGKTDGKSINDRNRIKTEKVKLEAKLEVDSSKFDEDLRKLKIVETNTIRAEEQAVVRIRLDFTKLTGGVDTKALQAQLDEQFRIELERAKTANDTGPNGTVKRIELIKAATIAQTQFNEATRELGVTQAALAQKEADINQTAQKGLIGEFEQQAQIRAAREALLPILQQQIDKLKEIAATIPTEATAELIANGAKIASIQTQINAITPTVVDFSTQAGVAFQNNLAAPLNAVLTQTQTIPQAFANMLKSIAAQLISSNINKLLTDLFTPNGGGQTANSGLAKLLASLFGGGSGDGLAATNVSGKGAAFATGGAVRGPGGPTSDSIPARLSDGEFVTRAASTRSVGVDVMHFINKFGKLPTGGYRAGGLAKIGRAGNFATGGLVGGGGGRGDVNVSLVNQSGTPLNAKRGVDPRTGQIQIILEDLRTNGPLAQAITGTFGTPRRAR